MENHVSVTGWQKCFSHTNASELSAAVAIATFEIYGWKFSAGYLVLIYSLCYPLTTFPCSVHAAAPGCQVYEKYITCKKISDDLISDIKSVRK